jgi:hypothetical protein
MTGIKNANEKSSLIWYAYDFVLIPGYYKKILFFIRFYFYKGKMQNQLCGISITHTWDDNDEHIKMHLIQTYKTRK